MWWRSRSSRCFRGGAETGKAPGGVAVAVHVDGRTLFMNFGDAAPGRPVTSDSLFNLASIGKVFVSTLLAQAVKQGDVALDDPVAKYVTELQRGGDIKRVTLGQLASHTSGLTSTPQVDLAQGPVHAARLHPLSQRLAGGRGA